MITFSCLENCVLNMISKVEIFVWHHISPSTDAGLKCWSIMVVATCMISYPPPWYCCHQFDESLKLLVQRTIIRVYVWVSPGVICSLLSMFLLFWRGKVYMLWVNRTEQSGISMISSPIFLGCLCHYFRRFQAFIFKSPQFVDRRLRGTVRRKEE